MEHENCDFTKNTDFDPTFGGHIVIGGGGVLVELLRDSSVLILPDSQHF